MRRAGGHDLSPAAKGVRRLKSVALALLAAGDPARGAALAKAQYRCRRQYDRPAGRADGAGQP